MNMVKHKILYVDDEEMNLLLFEANLESEYQILTAENGFKGLEIISNHQDLKIVISDLKMPEMNGIEFIKKAKKQAPDIRFYILTGFEKTREMQEAIDQGLIRKYFHKPFDMNAISLEIGSE